MDESPSTPFEGWRIQWSQPYTGWGHPQDTVAQQLKRLEAIDHLVELGVTIGAATSLLEQLKRDK